MLDPLRGQLSEALVQRDGADLTTMYARAPETGFTADSRPLRSWEVRSFVNARPQDIRTYVAIFGDTPQPDQPDDPSIVVLNPVATPADESFGVLLPAPFIGELVRSPETVGLVAWRPDEGIVLVDPERASELPADTSEWELDGFDWRWWWWSWPRWQGDTVTSKAVGRRRLLHLSDIHFGTPDSDSAAAYITGWIRSTVPDADRVVITGDLMDSPTADRLGALRAFLSELTSIAGEPVLVVGNHDQRWHGLSAGRLGRDGTFIDELVPDRLVVDDSLGAIFFCFNSSEGGSLARGRISKGQLRGMGALYEHLVSDREEVASYRKIALVHHHPLPIRSERPSSPIQRFRTFAFGEYTKAMKNGSSFVRWCADRDVCIVLHGHKHLSRHAAGEVLRDQQDGRRSTVDVIGCGTSVGVHDKPISVNVIEWDESTGVSTVTFYEDPGDGSGLIETSVFRESPVPVPGT